MISPYIDQLPQARLFSLSRQPSNTALSARFRALRSSAPFWSLRYHEESHEQLAVRQDTLEPPRLSIDRGAMLTAVTGGGFGYCATSDLSVAGLQAALDRAAAWAEATRARSVVRFDPERMPAPRGQYAGPSGAEALGRSALHDLLAQECKRAKIDDRIVERYAALELIEEERVYLTNTGGELRQQVRFTLPHAHVAANHGAGTGAVSVVPEGRRGAARSCSASSASRSPHPTKAARSICSRPPCCA